MSQQCPNELQQQSIRTCVRPNEPGGQTSLNFSSNAVSYSKVCGKVRAYQSGYADAFRTYHDSGRTLGLYFVNGVVLAQGNTFGQLSAFVMNTSLSDCYPCLACSFIWATITATTLHRKCDSGSRDHFINGMFYGDGTGLVANLHRAFHLAVSTILRGSSNSCHNPQQMQSR